MSLERLISYIAELIKTKYTGQVRLNFINGNLSLKIEKKENIMIG